VIETNRSTLHTIYTTVCHAGQQWHTLSRRTAT